VHLTSINVSSTNASTRCIQQLSAMAHLTKLYADDLSLRAQDLTFFANSSVALLSIDGSTLNDRAIPALLSLSNLADLQVRKSSFSKVGLRKLLDSDIRVGLR
jgi:hypothetical protein